MRIESSISARRPRQSVTTNRGFSLIEVILATTILGMAMGMTMVVFIAAMKRATHTELALSGTSELRRVADEISLSIRSTAALPTIGSAGTELIFSPKALPYLEVTGGNMSSGTIRAWSANQRTLQLDAVVPAVTSSIFAGAARPSGALTTSDLGTYFVTAAPPTDPAFNLSNIYSAGSTVSIPGTPSSPPITRTVNSVSRNAGRATVTFTANLGFDIPEGTVIRIANAKTSKYVVTAAGDLIYYPDASTTTGGRVIAREITQRPLNDPSNAASGTTVPFTISSTASNYVIINLQKIPKGNPAGRTLQGVQTTVFMRTNPLAP